MNMTRRTFLRLSAITAAGATLASCGTWENWQLRSAPVPGERGVNFGFEDVSDDTYDWVGAAQRLMEVGATTVSLAVGRVEWVAFEWEQYPDTLAVGEGQDLVASAINTLGGGLSLSLVIDALVPRMIEEDQNLAGVNPEGERSTDFASVTALRDGAVGNRMVELAVELAARYNPQRIVLTELMFDDYTFGDNDLPSYQEFSGNEDWPRNEDGAINTTDQSIADWRSAALEVLAGKITAALPSEVALEFDVRASWEDPAGDRALSGHDYDMLLSTVDRIAIWNYSAMNNIEASYSEDLAASLTDRYGERYTMSVGLWGEGGSTVTPKEMARALQYSARGGATAVSVTPASMMTQDHWGVLKEIWS